MIRIHNKGPGWISYRLPGLRYLVLAWHRKSRGWYWTQLWSKPGWRLWLGRFELEYQNYRAKPR